MNKILGIILIFAAAWLMFKLQAGNGSSDREEHEQENSGAFPENGQSCKEEGEVHPGEKPEKDRLE